MDSETKDRDREEERRRKKETVRRRGKEEREKRKNEFIHIASITKHREKMLLFPAVLMGHCWHLHPVPECLFYHQMCCDI